MFRIIGVTALSGLAAASLWLAGRSHAQEVPARPANPFEDFSTSAPAAQPAGPAADPFGSEPAQGATGAGATGTGATGVGDVARRRIADALRKAGVALQEGRRDEAMRLATAADQMARQYQVSFPANEPSPAKMIALIQNGASDVPAAESRPAAGIEMPQPGQDKKQYARLLLQAAQDHIRRGEFDAARRKATQAAQANREYGPFDLRPDQILAEVNRQQPASPDGPSTSFTASFAVPAAQAAEAAPATGPASAASADPKTQATQFLRLAREAIDNEQYTAARSYALEAQKFRVSYELFDDRPEHVLSDIERLTGTKIIAGQEASAAPASNAAGDRKQQALGLLSEARQELAQGRLETARQKARQASDLNVAFGLFDDRPELVMQEIRGAETGEMMAQSRTPAAPATTPATEHPQASDKQQALGLLDEARSALQNGDVTAAEQKVAQAEQYDIAYGLFDDRPEMVREDIQRIADARKRQTSGDALASAGEPALSLEQQKQMAVQLVKEAQAALESGRIQEAREKAAAADKLNATFDLFETTPQLVLAQIDRAAQENTPAAADGTQPSPFAGNPLLDGVPGDAATSETEAPRRDAMVVRSTGESALELYNRGVQSLRQGDRSAAYEAFLSAYQSGERLDPYRQQQLQDKLRELSPRGEIRQASNEQLSGAPSLELEPGHLDEAVEQQQIKYDRLRTEVLNAVFRAEQLREKSPDQAVQILDQTLGAIEQSGLSEQQTSPLIASVQSSRSSIQTYMSQRAPVLELERKNAEVRQQIEADIATKVRVEQELAKLVEDFNRLMDQRRFAEAQVVAKEAKELDADNPVVVGMDLKSKMAYRVDRNDSLRNAKEESFWKQLDDVEWSAVNPTSDANPLVYPDARSWAELTARRQKYNRTDALERSAEELRVRQSLNEPVSLHFEDKPLTEIAAYIAQRFSINVVLDEEGLNEEGVTPSTLININVDGIQLKNALDLILKQIHLDYAIENEVLLITSRIRQQGELQTLVYPVADLIVPITGRNNSATFQPGTGYGLPSSNFNFPGAGGPMSIGSTGGLQNGGGLAQVPADPLTGQPVAQDMSQLSGQNPRLGGGAQDVHFGELSSLIMTTVEPGTWDEIGGQGSINRHPSTLSLVIRQTQKVHQEITDLLQQLRRLQDLQVTIEVRFITVSDRFFERIGIDFDFNVQDTVGGPFVDNNFNPIRPFGTTDPIFGGPGAGGGQQGQQGGGGGQQGQQGGGGQQGQQGGGTVPTAPFGRQPILNLTGRDNYPSRTVVGLAAPSQFSGDLDIPFRQGSFELGVPDFGNFQPEAGIQFGMAILSDIEAFLFVQAAQGDERANIMFAPKLTLFNGSIGSVSSQVRRPFVISLTPVVSAFAIGFQPEITVIPDGVSLTVTAVVSADRRYVRLAVFPFFSNVTDVFTFSFISGGGAGGGGGGGGLGGGGGGGGGFGGGGLGGGGFGGGGGGFGGGGIQGGGQGGGGGQQGQQGAAAGGAVTVQQPVVDTVTVDTVVSVPDGGTVLLGGVKRLREGRNMNGVPILNKIPYISRLFKNTGVGRETDSLMLMVTPRIIIQEEEEELLGIPPE